MSVPPKEEDAIVSQTDVVGLHVLAGSVQMASMRVGEVFLEAYLEKPGLRLMCWG